MTRTFKLALAALAIAVASPLAAGSADAFFIKAGARKTSVTESATLGLRADQLKIGSKRWFEQMEREGRLGGPRS